MIVEERIYTLYAGKVPTYMKLYEGEGLAIQQPILGKMVGWYFTDFGPQNQIIHIWAYNSYAERDKRRAKLAKNPKWQAFLPKILPLIRKQENKSLLVAPWSPNP